MKLSIWWPTYGNSIRMGGATSRMGGATSFPYPALPSRFKSLLNATRCTLLMVLYLDRMCQCGLHAVPWLHIGILMRHLAAEPHSTAALLFPSQCPCGMIFLTPCSMVWDRLVSRAGPMFFLLAKAALSLLLSSTIFPFLFFLFIGWYCGAGVFVLIRCIPLSLSLALPTSFNNNNNNMCPLCEW